MKLTQPLPYIIIALGVYVLGVSACKKEPAPQNQTNNISATPPDTIFPHDYFPAYPGSFWTYESAFGDTITYTTNPTYELFARYSDYYPVYDSSLYYAPVWNGKVFYQNRITSASSYDYHEWVTFFPSNLTLGALFTSSKVYQGNDLEGKIMALHDTMTINGIFYDSVMEIHYSIDPVPWPYYKRVFAKNVGLVEEIYYNPIDTSKIEHLVLENHYVNF